LLAKKLYQEASLYEEQIKAWKRDQQKLVFTNGCFDIFHAGHAAYLEEAANLGDKLIVGLNADSSVKQLKGADRPINKLEHRAMVLSALASVDMIIEFKEETPYELIIAITPDILVKGGDYSIEQMIAKEFIEKNGGQVKILSFLEGLSSSTIISKIQRSSNED